jgi:hypothetical protein
MKYCKLKYSKYFKKLPNGKISLKEGNLVSAKSTVIERISAGNFVFKCEIMDLLEDSLGVFKPRGVKS